MLWRFIRNKAHIFQTSGSLDASCSIVSKQREKYVPYEWKGFLTYSNKIMRQFLKTDVVQKRLKRLKKLKRCSDYSKKVCPCELKYCNDVRHLAQWAITLKLGLLWLVSQTTVLNESKMMRWPDPCTCAVRLALVFMQYYCSVTFSMTAVHV